MSTFEKKQELHDEVMELWRRYQALSREMLVTEGRAADLRAKINEAGKNIYELYQKSSAGLDGDGEMNGE